MVALRVVLEVPRHQCHKRGNNPLRLPVNKKPQPLRWLNRVVVQVMLLLRYLPMGNHRVVSQHL